MLKVRDLMSRVVFTVAADDSAESAAESLARARTSGTPVRDKVGALVGILSQADLTNAGLAGKRRHPTVSDMMTPDLGVYEDDAALAAALKMANHDIHRLLVRNADGEVAGIVTLLDLVKASACGADLRVEMSDLAGATAKARRKLQPDSGRLSKVSRPGASRGCFAKSRSTLKS